MAFEKFGKMLGNMASTTAKKATEQAQIAKLGLDRAGIERQIEGVYAAMGKFCFNLAKSGAELPEELKKYCRDIETLMAQLAELDNSIAAHKTARDAAEYTVTEDFKNLKNNAEPVEYVVTEDIPVEETAEAAEEAAEEPAAEQPAE